MGIPGFAQWLYDRYPLIAQRAIKDYEMPIIDHFYIDMNSILYQQVGDGYILQKYFIDKDEEQLIEAVCDKVEKLIKYIQPQHFIYLTFDGVPPAAKFRLNRAKRHEKVVMEKHFKEFFQQELQTDQEILHSSRSMEGQFSCGSEFMYQLDIGFKKFIEHKIQTDPIWKNVQVYFSGSCSVGQGEHKIVQFIRNYTQNKENDPNTTHCIYSNDADVIILGVITRANNVCILKDSLVYDNGESLALLKRKDVLVQQNYEFIFLNLVRQYLLAEANLKLNDPSTDIFLESFFFCISICGNDFVPRSPSLFIKNGALDHLFILMGKSLLQENQPLLDEQGNVLWQNFLFFIKDAAQFEEKNLQFLIQEFFPNKPATQAIDYKMLQKLYYVNQLGFSPTTSELAMQKQIDEIVVNYLEILEFIIRYYKFGPPSWRLMYSYNYPPLLCNVHSYLTRNPEFKVNFEKNPKGNVPFSPFENLGYINSVINSHIIKNEFSTLYEEPNALAKSKDFYFPLEIKTDSFGSIADYDAIVDIPVLTINEYQQAIEEIKLGEQTLKSELSQPAFIDFIYKYDQVSSGIKIQVAQQSKLVFNVQQDPHYCYLPSFNETSMPLSFSLQNIAKEPNQIHNVYTLITPSYQFPKSIPKTMVYIGFPGAVPALIPDKTKAYPLNKNSDDFVLKRGFNPYMTPDIIELRVCPVMDFEFSPGNPNSVLVEQTPLVQLFSTQLVDKSLLAHPFISQYNFSFRKDSELLPQKRVILLVNDQKFYGALGEIVENNGKGEFTVQIIETRNFQAVSQKEFGVLEFVSRQKPIEKEKAKIEEAPPKLEIAPEIKQTEGDQVEQKKNDPVPVIGQEKKEEIHQNEKQKHEQDSHIVEKVRETLRSNLKQFGFESYLDFIQIQAALGISEQFLFRLLSSLKFAIPDSPNEGQFVRGNCFKQTDLDAGLNLVVLDNGRLVYTKDLIFFIDQGYFDFTKIQYSLVEKIIKSSFYNPLVLQSLQMLFAMIPTMKHAQDRAMTKLPAVVPATSQYPIIHFTNMIENWIRKSEIQKYSSYPVIDYEYLNKLELQTHLQYFAQVVENTQNTPFKENVELKVTQKEILNLHSGQYQMFNTLEQIAVGKIAFVSNQYNVPNLPYGSIVLVVSVIGQNQCEILVDPKSNKIISINQNDLTPVQFFD